MLIVPNSPGKTQGKQTKMSTNYFTLMKLYVSHFISKYIIRISWYVLLILFINKPPHLLNVQATSNSVYVYTYLLCTRMSIKYHQQSLDV